MMMMMMMMEGRDRGLFWGGGPGVTEDDQDDIRWLAGFCAGT
jgi:hypothetical protein